MIPSRKCIGKNYVVSSCFTNKGKKSLKSSELTNVTKLVKNVLDLKVKLGRVGAILFPLEL